MRHWIPMLLVAALTATAAVASDVQPKHHKRYPAGQAAVPPPYPAWPYPPYPPSPYAPAHMIEAKPGVWISSYGCITEDSQNRWFPCSSGGAR